MSERIYKVVEIKARKTGVTKTGRRRKKKKKKKRERKNQNKTR